MDKEEVGSLTDPPEGWSHDEQYRPTLVGRCVHSDPLFADGVGPTPAQATRLDSDIMALALTLAGAGRAPSEEFWNLTEFGDSVAVLQGRDFEVWSLQRRPACAYRHDFRSGKLAQRPLMTLAGTPPGIRLSSPRETVPFLASYQQVGLPAVAASDDQAGRSAYTYQSGEAAFRPRGADKHVLWRVVGQHSRARGQTGIKTRLRDGARRGCVCAAARPSTLLSRVSTPWGPILRPRTSSCSFGRHWVLGAPQLLRFSVRCGEWVTPKKLGLGGIAPQCEYPSSPGPCYHVEWRYLRFGHAWRPSSSTHRAGLCGRAAGEAQCGLLIECGLQPCGAP